ncbi:MAG: 4Fe-4S binding protein [Treponema sp.]|nr:4Fe-4S binding protein [Treponema sp.]
MKHPVIAARLGVQIVLGAIVFVALGFFNIPILWVLAVGIGISVIAGKVFCRWACPIGLLMEFIFSKGGDEAQSQYMYHKLGCPIAWAGGFLNRFSPFRITRNASSCIDCGLCDKACYIPKFNADTSIYKPGASRPTDSYTCSRCLKCVQACPNESLSFRFAPLRRGD